MIKINLATRKRATAHAGTKNINAGTRTVFTSMTEGLSRLDIESLKSMPARRLIVNGLAAAAAYWLLDTYKSDEIAVLDVALAKQATEQAQLETEIRKYTNVDEKQKTLKSDENLIRTKMEAVMALSQGRGNSPKVLMTLSAGIPKELWLESIRYADSEFRVSGFSYTSQGTGYDQITDFMTLLGQSAYLSDVKLVNTEKKADESGTEVASFELSARKR